MRFAARWGCTSWPEAAGGDFGDPVEALAWAHRSTSRIDALVTDVVMPGLDGRALADQGGIASGAACAVHQWLHGRCGRRPRRRHRAGSLLRKPFSRVALAASVEALLRVAHGGRPRDADETGNDRALTDALVSVVRCGRGCSARKARWSGLSTEASVRPRMHGATPGRSSGTNALRSTATGACGRRIAAASAREGSSSARHRGPVRCHHRDLVLAGHLPQAVSVRGPLASRVETARKGQRAEPGHSPQPPWRSMAADRSDVRRRCAPPSWLLHSVLEHGKHRIDGGRAVEHGPRDAMDAEAPTTGPP